MSYSPYNLDAADDRPKSEAKRVTIIVLVSLAGFAVTVFFLSMLRQLPGYLEIQRASNEASAVTTLRSIAAAEAAYRAKHMKYGTGEELAAGGYIDRELAQPRFERDGYVFKLRVISGDDKGPAVWSYVVEAHPVTRYGLWATGRSYFYKNSFSESIHVKASGPASASDPYLVN